MPLELGVWRVDGETVEITPSGMSDEKRLEDILAESIEIASPNWMLVGRQVMTSCGTPIDLLGLDRDGNLVVIELKRNRTPRDVVAQLLGYASWVKDLRDEDVAIIFEEYQKRYGAPGKALSVDEAFRSRFGLKELPEVLNEAHSLVIVAAELDPSTERIVRYLADEHGVPVNAVFFRVFRDGDREYLTRAWFIDPTEPVGETPRRGSKEPWNNEYYVCFGHGEHRRWEDAMKYGFVSAGGGDWYTGTLDLLEPGGRVWVYVPDHGYVGVGAVRGPRQPFDEFTVRTGEGARLISEVDLAAPNMAWNTGDRELCEYLVPIEWLKAVPLAAAAQEKGFFRNQNTVCRPRSAAWQHTVERLKQRFDVR
jgi:hypothetical protein